ncbi:LytR/AlgR family response regulator transcription factor [Sphingobacterium bambusae]|uniref:LytR/AlgR family response regulator transcription factor n=1 Tax=Sphingobacterium bambusae TaxID=662858 RepID=A0ABW6BKS1_9SPHI|nr:LytTR family DNA-binding domain-containing protein [Sphingobacterium bambusae]WPL49315.1 LytTR family DNA-binding domain-containing protein [Sphingobacterium bambusae]
MIAIAIDDEPMALEVIEHHTSKVPFVDLKETFTDAFMALDYLQAQPVDLIFLDIKMPDISGMELLKSLQTVPMVIFTTAYSEHALQSFELDAIDYLLKPFSMPRFLKACNKANELYLLRSAKTNSEKDYFFVKDGYEHVKIAFDDILYVEASGNYTQIQLQEQLISSRITLNELAELLPKTAFVRCHRAFIVARSKVTKFDKGQIWVRDKIIPIGSTYTDLKLH